MRCPSCQAQVPAGTVICPKCDHILDASAFDAEPPSQTGDSEVSEITQAPKGKPAASARTASRPATARKPAAAASAGTGTRRPTTASKPAGKPAPRRTAMPEAPPRRAATPPEQRAAQEDWRWKPDPNEAPRGGRTNSGIAMVDPEDALADVKNFVAALSSADKIAFVGALGTLLSCFLPWKDTITEGEVLGLMSLGAAVAAISLLIVTAIVVRVRSVMPRLPAFAPWLVQFGGACFCVVWCLVCVKLALDTTLARSPIGNFERMVSSPSAGVFIAILTSLVTLGGTLMGLREKPA